MSGRALLASLLVALAPLAARAQEIVDDAWTATWTEGRKSSWTRRTIERSGVGWVVSSTTVVVVDRGGRWTTTSRVATDLAGRVLELRTVDAAPWGTTTLEVASVDSGARWQRRIRALPPQTGWLDEAPFEPHVVLRLLLPAEVAEVSTEVATLQPGLRVAVAPTLVGARRWPDGSTGAHVDGRVVSRRSADGAERPRAHGPGLRVGRTTAARAADLDEPAPEVDAPPVPAAPTPGLTVRRPGPEWSLRREPRDGMTLGVAHLVHPSATWVSALIEDGRMIGDTADERLRFAAALARRFGDAARGAPVRCAVQGREAYRFAVGQSVAGVDFEGEVMLLDLGTARATLMLLQPSDLRPRRFDDLLGLDAFDLAEVPRTWQRVSMGDLSTDAPGHWTEWTLGTFQGWSLGSCVRLCREPLAGRTLEEVHARVRVPAEEGVEVVEEERVTAVVDGRAALVVVERASMVMPDGNRMTIRSGACLADVGDGVCEAVVVKALGNELDRDEVARILGSARWSR